MDLRSSPILPDSWMILGGNTVAGHPAVRIARATWGHYSAVGDTGNKEQNKENIHHARLKSSVGECRMVPHSTDDSNCPQFPFLPMFS